MFHDVGRNLLEDMGQHLLNSIRLVKCVAGSSKDCKWLDVLSGPIASGSGEFKLGSVN